MNDEQRSQLAAALNDLVMKSLRSGISLPVIAGHLERQVEVLRLVQPYAAAMRDSEMAP